MKSKVKHVRKKGAAVRVKRVVGPLEACIRMERLLRGADTYHIAMDYPTCKLGLGKWLKRVIRNAKRPNS